MIQALGLDRENPPLRERGEIGAPGRELEAPDTGVAKDGAKGVAELGVSIVNQKASVLEETPVGCGFVSRDLLHELGVGIGSDVGNSNCPRFQVDEEEDVIRHEPTSRPDHRGEEVCCVKNVHVRLDEAPARSFSCGAREQGEFRFSAHAT